MQSISGFVCRFAKSTFFLGSLMWVTYFVTKTVLYTEKSLKSFSLDRRQTDIAPYGVFFLFILEVTNFIFLWWIFFPCLPKIGPNTKLLDKDINLFCFSRLKMIMIGGTIFMLK